MNEKREYNYYEENCTEDKYGDNTIYIISYAQFPENMSVTLAYKYVGIGFIIDTSTGIIIDTACTYLTHEARKFIKDLIVGYNLNVSGIEPLIEKVKKRFHGPSQKSVCVLLRDNYNKYLNIMKTF
jgi:hypothetical protein